MKRAQPHTDPGGIRIQLVRSGLRLTAQRSHVYRVLLQKRDHPTAEELFLRARRGMPEISLATVYNCLDALVHCGLARRVTVDPAARRFCPNMQEHGHFVCEGCGGIHDLDMGDDPGVSGVALPRGFRATRFDLAVRGWCADCARAQGRR